jgi:hypothetical protein
MWMNESEIDEALHIVQRHAPEFAPYVKYLSDWRDTINQNSDGWAYWKAGIRCASNLMDLVERLMSALRERGKTAPTAKEFDRALTPIKSCATRHKLPVPVLGQAASGEEAIEDDMEYVSWVEGTLVPDLKASGTVETAADFGRLIKIIRRLAELHEGI